MLKRIRDLMVWLMLFVVLLTGFEAEGRERGKMGLGVRADVGPLILYHTVGAAVEWQINRNVLVEAGGYSSHWIPVIGYATSTQTARLGARWVMNFGLYFGSGIGLSYMRYDDSHWAFRSKCLPRGRVQEPVPAEPDGQKFTQSCDAPKDLSRENLSLTVPATLGWRRVAASGFILDLEAIGLETPVHTLKGDETPNLRLLTLGLGYQFN